MSPQISEEGIVWQAWDGNDWEIMFYDGKFTDQITDNEIQDVTPVVEDGYVLWSIIGGKKQEARVYSIDTGEVLTIAGHEGGAVANPRFVLVYDTMFDNGDVVTQGFDPVTGLSAPIAAKPAPLPIEIPTPDPIGEIRALIQNKSTQKEADVVTKISSNNAGDLNLNSQATSSDTLTVQGNNIESDSVNENGISTTTVDVSLPFELTEYDLVITPEATSTSTEDILNELPLITEKTSSSTQE